MSLSPSERIYRRPNHFALDASCVAMVWFAAIAHEQSVSVAWQPLAVLGMSVWLVYVGDRWLDVLGRGLETLPTKRHRLVSRHHRAFFVTWFVVLIVDVMLAIMTLPRIQLLAGFVVLVASISYTLGIQRRASRRTTKELQIGMIFAAGVGIFLVGLPIESMPWLLATLLIFGLVCFTNCALLARWEMDADRRLGRASLPMALGKHVRLLGHFTLMLGVVGLLLGTARPAIRCLGVYAVSLWLMDSFSWPVEAEDRRCAADGLLAVMGALALLV